MTRVRQQSTSNRKSAKAEPARLSPARDGVMIAAGSAVLHIILGLALLTPAPYHGGDNATYVALARSLLENGRYVELWDPLHRSATLYPPLFPVVLAAAIAVGIKTWIQLKVLALAISAAAVAVSVLWLHRVAGMRAALAGGIILAVSPGILEQAGYVLSEGLFWLCTIISLWAISHIEILRPDSPTRSVRDGDHRTRWLLIAAIAAAAAAITRSTGLPLIVAITGALLFSRRWRDASIFAAVALTPFIAWSLRGRLVGTRGYGSYLTMVDPYDPERGSLGPGDFVKRVLINVHAYVTEMAPSLVWSAQAVLRPLTMLIVIVALTWWLVRLIRNPDVVDLWMALYAGLLVIWPETWAGERFVLAAVPALIFFAADLLQTMYVRERALTMVVTGLMMLATVGLMPSVLIARISSAGACREYAGSGDEFGCVPAGFGDFMRIAEGARTILPREAVVISRKPTLFYAQSDLPSVMYPLSADPARFFATADSVRAEYLVLDQLSPLAEMYLHPIILSAPGRFCVMRGLQRDGALMMRILATARADAPAPNAEGVVSMKICEEIR